MAKEKKERFIVEFPLLTDKHNEDKLNKRMEIGRRLYNQLVRKTKDRYYELTQTEEWQNREEELKALRQEREEENERLKAESEATGKKFKEIKRLPRERELYAEKNDVLKANGFTDFGMQSLALKQSKPFIKNIDSGVATQIGGRLWRAWDTFFYRNGQFIHFCRYGDFNSLEGKSNKSGLKLKFGHRSKHWVGEKDAIVWNGLEIPVKINYNKPYEAMAVQHDIAYNRIVRKTYKGKTRFYLQVIFKGRPPLKIDANTGELKHPLGEGKVGVSVGAKYIAVASENEEFFRELADKLDDIAEEKAKVDRAMERSRRATNPDNYNEDGTAKKRKECKRWVYSKRYQRLRQQKKELERKQAALRKQQHFILANEIVSMGDTFIVAKRNYKHMQERKKETEKHENGKFKSKKMYGSVIADKAPAMLIEILNNKASQRGGELVKAETFHIEKNSDMDSREYKLKTAHVLAGHC